MARLYSRLDKGFAAAVSLPGAENGGEKPQKQAPGKLWEPYLGRCEMPIDPVPRNRLEEKDAGVFDTNGWIEEDFWLLRFRFSGRVGRL